MKKTIHTILSVTSAMGLILCTVCIVLALFPQTADIIEKTFKISKQDVVAIFGSGTIATSSMLLLKNLSKSIDRTAYKNNLDIELIKKQLVDKIENKIGNLDSIEKLYKETISKLESVHIVLSSKIESIVLNQEDIDKKLNALIAKNINSKVVKADTKKAMIEILGAKNDKKNNS